MLGYELGSQNMFIIEWLRYPTPTSDNGKQLLTHKKHLSINKACQTKIHRINALTTTIPVSCSKPVLCYVAKTGFCKRAKENKLILPPHSAKNCFCVVKGAISVFLLLMVSSILRLITVKRPLRAVQRTSIKRQLSQSFMKGGI